MFRSVGLVARFDKEEAIQLAEKLIDYLEGKGLKVYVEDTLTEKMEKKGNFVSLENFKVDFIIAIGGDGTILRTCLKLPKPEPPILAVNMGVRGFLAEVEPEKTFEAVDKCLSGNYVIEKCMKLSVTVNGVNFPDALNEVLISTDEPAKILYAKILKDNMHVLDCQADGLMVATQTGSTGYSLSAGGPVLDLNVNAFVLTPICALGMFRPVVFPADSHLKIEIVKPEKILVIIDGHHRQIVTSKSPSLIVTRSKYETSFIRLKENFYHRLRSRLLFTRGGKFES
ncbi:NAD(+)/NADH kinase [Candidatus Bathyarchaeota archaeon]|nr:NAD(+)/NADH kinase [Candidatus Bathyarchaeota archaeon]